MKKFGNKYQTLLFMFFMITALTASVCTAQDFCGGDTPCPPDPPPFPVGYPPKPESEERSPQRLKVNVRQISGSLGNHGSQAVAPGAGEGDIFRKPIFQLGANGNMTGLSAGDMGEMLKGLGVWGNFSYTSTEDDSQNTKSDADLYNFIIGADYRIKDNMVAGLSFTYEDMDTTTDFNKGNVTSDGFTIAPYFAMLINEYFGFDVNAGYSWISIDQKRKAKNDAGDDYLGYDISSSPDTERYFIALNANGYYKMDKWNFAGTLGYIYAKEDQDGFIEIDGTKSEKVSASTVELGQIYLKAEASYSFDSVEPYLNLGYEYDTTYDDENSSTFGKYEKYEDNLDKDGFTAALGLRYLLLETLQGDLQAAGIFGRDNYNEYTISLNLRYDF